MKNSEVDLLPDEWKSDREKPREPIFGRGAVPFLAEMILGVGALGLVFLALMFAGVVKDKAYAVFFGEPQQTVAPGNYSWTPERGLEPVRQGERTH